MPNRSSTPPRGERFPSRNPVNVDNNTWFYENRNSVDVVHHGGSIARIPMAKLCRVVDRYRMAKRK